MTKAKSLDLVPPPEGLSERSCALWASVVPSRAVSAARLAMVEEALRFLDRADEARRLLDAAGLTRAEDLHGRPWTVLVGTRPAKQPDR